VSMRGDPQPNVIRRRPSLTNLVVVRVPTLVRPCWLLTFYRISRSSSSTSTSSSLRPAPGFVNDSHRSWLHCAFVSSSFLSFTSLLARRALALDHVPWDPWPYLALSATSSRLLIWPPHKPCIIAQP